jgi:hypothetical protein
MTQWRNQPELCQGPDGSLLHLIEFEDRPRVRPGSVNAIDITLVRGRPGRVSERAGSSADAG